MTIGDIAILAYTGLLWVMGFLFLVCLFVTVTTWAQGYRHRRFMRRMRQLESWDMTGRRVTPRRH